MIEFVVNNVGYLVIATLMLFICSPVLIFLLTGWAAKCREILSAFASEKPFKHYFETFFPKEVPGISNFKEAFEERYYKHFGKRRFIIPGFCFFVVSVLDIIIAVVSLKLFSSTELSSKLTISSVAISALAGAYMWVSHDLISRARRKDISPTDLLWASLRLIIAIPLGLSVAALFKEEIGIFVGFAFGAFPTRTLFTIIRRLAASKMQLGDFSDEPKSELEKLQGINRSVAECISNEGITTILHLSYSDPVDLAISTNLSFNFITDCCSQALAWIYFTKDLEKMRQYGLRGGQEIYFILSDLDGKSDAEDNETAKKRARKTIEDVAALLNMGKDSLETTLREIAEDPHTVLLCDMWHADPE